MNALICESVPTVSAAGFPECAEGWITQIATLPFDVSQVDPVVAAQYFAGGFVLCLTPWAAAVGVKYLLRLIQYGP